MRVDVLRATTAARARQAGARTCRTACSSVAVDSAEPYLLRIDWPGAVQETEDPYSFGPLLGDLDLHLFNEGRHFELAVALGANVVTIDGVRGVRFAVWAPNARRGLGGRRLQHLGRRGAIRCGCAIPSGVWELFMPRLGAGRALQVRDRRAGRLAAAAEGRPAGARDRAAAGHRLGRRRSRRRMSGTTMHGWQARAARHARRCADLRSTRCMPRRGSVPDRTHARPGTRWPTGWCPMSARWASPTSS